MSLPQRQVPWVSIIKYIFNFLLIFYQPICLFQLPHTWCNNQHDRCHLWKTESVIRDKMEISHVLFQSRLKIFRIICVETALGLTQWLAFANIHFPWFYFLTVAPPDLKSVLHFKHNRKFYMYIVTFSRNFAIFCHILPIFNPLFVYSCKVHETTVSKVPIEQSMNDIKRPILGNSY